MSSAHARNTSTLTAPDVPPSILIVSELAAEGSAFASVLQTGPFHVVLVNSPAAAKVELAAREFATIVCAIKGGAGSASIETLASMREHRFNAFTPLLLLVPPKYDQGAAMRGLGVGIVDCISQPIDDLVLQSKVRMFVEMFRGKQRLREIEAQGSALLTDSLTGLPNRLLFMDRADQAMRQAARSGGRVALAAMDLEQIFEVKEALGPATGDELLRQIALRLTS
ncbi:MAG TPA: diguanylate cyclase, partial [Steroidobacteraceae bacterium]|nr:diguanylate cyclase [Steroidobacteraceae bacterium]